MKDHAIELVQANLAAAVRYAEILASIVPTAQAADVLVACRKAQAALDVLREGVK